MTASNPTLSPLQEVLGQVQRRTLLVSFLTLALFVTVAIFAYRATDGPVHNGITATPCGDGGWCVSQVFPASYAWTEGVRAGDALLIADGNAVDQLPTEFDWSLAKTLGVGTASGGVIDIPAKDISISRPPLSSSLWVVASAFAILGFLVWTRRPDLKSAAYFGLFSITAGVALAVAPASGGPSPAWSSSVQFLSMSLLGFLFFQWILCFVNEQGIRHRLLNRIVVPYLIVTALVIMGYGAAILITVEAYTVVRSAMLLLLAVGLLLPIGLLFHAYIRQGRRSHSSALRLPFWGTTIGLLPFLIFVMVPIVLYGEELIPSYLAVLPVVLIPASFAYSILQHQLWGIRRLVHRGLVYGLLSLLLMALISVAVYGTDRLLADTDTSVTLWAALLGLILVVGISAYFPVRRAIRWLVDKAAFGLTPSYPEFLQGLQGDLTGANQHSDVASALGNELCQRLNLEAVVMVGAPGDDGNPQVKSAVGERAAAAVSALESGKLRLPSPESRDSSGIINWEGEQLLSVPLRASGVDVGLLLLGPKRGGDLFVGTEVALVVNAAPFIAAALERHELSETMRLLNARLTDTEERERARMAIDLHDGPLQKAVALAWGQGYGATNSKELAQELVAELRELGSQLRPSILDDLGLPSSIEWILEQAIRSTDIRGTLSLEGLDEDTRLPSEVELALFRVTQEAINNVLKHANCDVIEVRIVMEGSQLTLSISDNGVGVGGVGSGRIPSSRLGLWACGSGYCKWVGSCR